MNKIKEVADKHVTLRRYSLSGIKDVESAIEWFGKARKISCLTTEYITLKDLTNRNDEGNMSKQLSPDVDINDIYNELSVREIDKVSLSGEYKNKPIVIGVDLNDKTVSITVRNKNRADIEEIEKLLGLDD